MNLRFQELDTLRGFAAILVVFFHFTMSRPEANLGFKVGVTGVDLFFIISGFVIFMSLNHIQKPIEFVINRFTRLFPTYWVCATFTYLLKIIFFNEAAMSLKHYLVNLSMLQYYFKIDDMDGPYWTMIIELIFYILMFIVLITNNLKNIIAIFSILLFLIFLNDTFLEVNFPSFNIIHEALPLINHFPLFFSGIIFYKIINLKILNTSKSISFYGLLLCCFIIQLMLFDNGGRSNGFITFKTYIAMLVGYFAIFILFINYKLKFIVNKISLFLGKISFALYLIHQFIGISLINFLTYRGFNYWFCFLIAFGLVILLATIITFVFEIPFSRYLNKKLKLVLIQTK
ncbi:MAG: acyltransferase [Flavobacterium sp.]|nr:acyltransferase [Flavobacterium sp.]